MKKAISILGWLVLVGGIIFAESKKVDEKQKPKPEPRIEQLGKVLFLEIVRDNWTNIPEELLPCIVYKIQVGVRRKIRYNDEGKKLVYIEEPDFTALRKDKGYKYNAIIKEVFCNPIRKRAGGRMNIVPCFNLPKKMGNIEIVSYTKDGKVKISIEYEKSKKSILLSPAETCGGDVVKRNIDLFGFLGFKNEEDMAERKVMDVSLIRQLIPKEGCLLFSQTRIINYGIADLEIEIYE